MRVGMPKKISGTNSFASYGRRDYEIVRPFVEILRVPDRLVFLDRDSILPGRKWRAEIEQALTDANVVFVFWTKNASKSVWVKREYNFAIRQNKQVIPVLLDSTPLPRTLKKFQWIDFRARYAAEGASTRNLQAFRAVASIVLLPLPIRIPQWLLRIIESLPSVRIPKWAMWAWSFIGVVSLIGLVYLRYANTSQDTNISQSARPPLSIDTVERPYPVEIVRAENEPVKVIDVYPLRRSKDNKPPDYLDIHVVNATSKSIDAVAYIIVHDSCPGVHSHAGIYSYRGSGTLEIDVWNLERQGMEIHLPKVGNVKVYLIHRLRGWYGRTSRNTSTSISPSGSVRLTINLEMRWYENFSGRHLKEHIEGNCEIRATPLLFLYKVAFSDGTWWEGHTNKDNSSEWIGSHLTPRKDSNSP